MCCERWSTRKTLTWIRDYHGPDGGDPHENKHRAATEALTLMDERNAAVALLRRVLNLTGDHTDDEFCALADIMADIEGEHVTGTTHTADCLFQCITAFLATLTPAEGEG